MAIPTFRQRLGALISGRTPETKQSQVMQAIIQAGLGSARWSTVDYTSSAREGYGRNPYVYAAITQIARTFAGINWKVYADATKERELPDHPMKLLLDRPNPYEAHSVFFEKLIAYLLLDGNSFIQATGPKQGPPLELWVLRPDRTSVVPGSMANPIAGYIYMVGSEKVPLPAATVRHLKLFNPLDDWRGLSPISAAAMSIDQSNESKQWNVALLQNGARPPGAMSTTSLLEDTAYQRLKEQIQDEYSGFMNAGRPLLLEGGVTWQEMGMSPQDMHWIEGQKLSAREIAIVYNIAPELLADSANKTYSNYGEARTALYEENVLPRSDWVRDEINAWLSPMYPDAPFCDYAKEDIEALQEGQDAVYDRATKVWQAGLVKLNEGRKMLGLDPEEDEDKGNAYQWEVQSLVAPPEPPPVALPGADQPPQLPPGNAPNKNDNGTGTNADEGPDTGDQPAKTGTDGGPGGVDATKRVIVPFARGPHSTRKLAATTSNKFSGLGTTGGQR